VTPVADIVDEAERVLASARDAGVPLRLIGGLAIHRRARGDLHPALRRTYADIDMATPKGRGQDVARLLAELGYEPDREFNALQGHRRLLFYDVAHERKLDVFVGTFEMCHAIPVTERIDADPEIVPLAELLLTKLQVVELNEKDLRDVVALLLHFPVTRDDVGINGPVVARLLAGDWGLWRTTRLNVERLRERIGEYALSDDERAVVLARADELWALVEAEPKSRGWRMRDRVGDRKRWYEEPEEVA
jgi:hypothetical protein